MTTTSTGRKEDPIDDAVKSEQGEYVTCESCESLLLLSAFESQRRKFTCPECGCPNQLESSTISDATRAVLTRGTIETTFREKLDFWLPALWFFGVVIMVLFHDPIPRDTHVLLIAFVCIGLFLSYRAVISPRITFVPRADSMSMKRHVVSRLRQRFKWILVESKDGVTIYKDPHGFNPKQVLMVCRPEGYYFHYMVHDSNLDGVSIIDTLRVKYAIRKLSEKAQWVA